MRALGALAVDAVGDGVHQVRLAEAGAAADEERVVAAPAAARGRDGRGVGELVRGADDEAREGVLGVDVVGRRRDAAQGRTAPPSRLRPLRVSAWRRRRRGRAHGRRGRGSTEAPRRAGERAPGHDRARAHGRHLSAAGDGRGEVLVDGPGDLDGPPRQLANVVGQRGEEVVLDPLEDELVLHPQGEHAVGQIVELDAPEPLVERRGRERARVLHRSIENRPRLVTRVRHRASETSGPRRLRHTKAKRGDHPEEVAPSFPQGHARDMSLTRPRNQTRSLHKPRARPALSTGSPREGSRPFEGSHQRSSSSRAGHDGGAPHVGCRHPCCSACVRREPCGVRKPTDARCFHRVEHTTEHPTVAETPIMLLGVTPLIPLLRVRSARWGCLFGRCPCAAPGTAHVLSPKRRFSR